MKVDVKMKCINRYEKYRDDDFDKILLLIKKGDIRCGKYSTLVKVDKDKKILNRKEFFGNEDSKSK